VQNEHGPALRQSGNSPEATFILGGQIAGEAPGLFMVYSQGNAIAATRETPYLQIGENKYGKTSLDLIAQPQMSLDDAARLCLVSLLGTARSNLTVGPPFEVAVYPRDSLALSTRLKLDEESEELKIIASNWRDGLRGVFRGLPSFGWG
jgi:putative proteasome-type protease